MVKRPESIAWTLPDYGSVRVALVRAEASLSEESWARGANALDWRGRVVDISDPRAVRYCIFGSVLRFLLPTAANRDLLYVGRLLNLAAARLTTGPAQTIFDFNDAPETTLADAHRLLREALVMTFDHLKPAANDVPGEASLWRRTALPPTPLQSTSVNRASAPNNVMILAANLASAKQAKSRQ